MDGDIVLTYAGIEMNDIKQLINETGNHPDTESVEITVLRNHQQGRYTLKGGKIGVRIRNVVLSKREAIASVHGQAGENTESVSGSGESIPLLFRDDSGLYGYKDSNGRILIEPKYFSASDFSRHGIASVEDRKHLYIIDTTGKVLLKPFIYDFGVDPFHEGMARFVENGKVGFYDETGKIVIPAQFDVVWPFSDGLAKFIKDDRKGCIDHKGKEVNCH